MKRSDPVRARERRLRALERQIARLDRALANLATQSGRLAQWRLLSFVLLLVAGAVILLTWGPYVWLASSLLLLFIFGYFVYRHRRVESDAMRLRIWRQLKLDQLARMTLDWEHIPPAEAVDERFEHAFGRDLDLVGSRSVQRLLDLSITVEGSTRLRAWLLAFEPDLAELTARQSLVRELTLLPMLSSRLTLSARLATDADDAASAQERPSRWSGESLLRWLDLQPDKDRLRLVLIVLVILAGVNLLLYVGYVRGLLPPVFLLSWFVYASMAVTQSRLVGPVFLDAAAISDSLRQLGAVFSCLEIRSFARFPALAALTAPLRQPGANPSDLLRRTNRLLAAAGLRYNPLIAIVLNALFPLDFLVAYRLEQLKEELAIVLPQWLSIWYDLEALGSLANFAYLYPEATFATVEPQSLGTNAPLPFTGRNLGHPLIVAEQRVTNDFQVDELGTLVIITGSNMAGKSTFLRTLGINMRLALTGAPVLASDLRMIPFRVFASITVTDSLADGISFFYAEVRRLKMLLNHLQETQQAPVFFLIDEIFRGTNNRERLIGSRSYVKTLVGGNGCGAIATHDLELVQLADNEPAIRNYHFRDDVVDGRMAFDYKLHPGPCPTTNALRIMTLAGLPVDAGK